MDAFVWPWQYHFPPFFTMQLNQETKLKQLDAWMALVLEYSQFKRIYILDVKEAQQSDLFFNRQINRRLSYDGIITVLEYMKDKGRIEWLDKKKTRCSVYWKTPAEWASLIYNWAIKTGHKNSVCTIYELMHGPDAEGEAFHDLEEKVILDALRYLEMEEKAELLQVGTNSGVKFF